MKYISGWLVCLLVFSTVVLTGCGTTRHGVDYMAGEADLLLPGMLDSEGLAVAAQSAELVGAPGAMIQAAPKDRLVVYHGSVALLVDSISERMDRTLRMVEEAGGYMQSMGDTMVVVKIPATKFGDVLARIEALGEVTYKNIVGEDVTDQMRDYRIRLKNAEEIRDRLVALLEKAEKVEDALMIEKELGRVTENIELLKGGIQVLEARISFSTLTVKFNSPIPQQAVKQEIPFPWVLQLGSDLVSGSRGANRYRSTRGWHHVKFDLPASFAKYEDVNYRTRATSADGVLLKVERHDNVDGGDLAFWTTFVRKALAAQRAILVKSVTETEVHRGRKGMILSGVKEIGGKQHGYMVAVALTDKHVMTYEAWGPIEAFGKAEAAIKKSITTVRP